MTLNHSGGLLLRWFRDTLGRREMEQAAVNGADAYDLLLAGRPGWPYWPALLPHFAGSGTPMLDVHSKGAILGLTFATTKAELAKAALEGLTFELRRTLICCVKPGWRSANCTPSAAAPAVTCGSSSRLTSAMCLCACRR